MTEFNHPPRILFLYGSLRERSYSRLAAEEAARIIQEFGAEAKFFDPRELPIYGSELYKFTLLLWDKVATHLFIRLE